MHELREDGLLKVLARLTIPDEVMRVVFTGGFNAAETTTGDSIG